MWNGRLRDLTWDAGVVTGDATLRLFTLHAATAQEGEPVGPVGGPSTTTHHLDDPLSALILLTRQFDTVFQVTGTVPRVPPVPPGAVV